MGKKKLFDFVIGNPPYDQEVENDTYKKKPIYNLFMDQTYEVAENVELIHPARFLFNAGDTPKKWNEKMLNDSHFKILSYEADSSKVFSNTDIKGGLAISYKSHNRVFEPIKIFNPIPELNSIRQKVWHNNKDENNLSTIISNRGQYRYSDLIYEEEPIEIKKTADRRIAPSSFERMPKIFLKNEPNDNKEYIKLLGNIKGKRTYRWFRKDYLKPISNLSKYKVIVSKANGTGALGETLADPLILKPGEGFTETYISIGEVNSFEEATSILKYIKTKFARCLLSILKVTHNNAKPVWRLIPLQNFTSSSDIDWSKSVHEIDLQLYRKYGLDEDEIYFIETHVKEMA